MTEQMTQPQARLFMEQAGRLIGGISWMATLEDRFGVTNRRLRRMILGTESIPDGLLQEIEQALRDHGQKLDQILEMVL